MQCTKIVLPNDDIFDKNTRAILVSTTQLRWLSLVAQKWPIWSWEAAKEPLKQTQFITPPAEMILLNNRVISH